MAGISKTKYAPQLIQTHRGRKVDSKPRETQQRIGYRRPTPVYGKSNLNSELTAILVVVLQLLFLLLLEQQVHGITASLLTFPPQVRWIYKTKYTHRVVGTYKMGFSVSILNNTFDSIWAEILLYSEN